MGPLYVTPDALQETHPALSTWRLVQTHLDHGRCRASSMDISTLWRSPGRVKNEILAQAYLTSLGDIAFIASSVEVV
jgi:hypothetical protein